MMVHDCLDDMEFVKQVAAVRWWDLKLPLAYVICLQQSHMYNVFRNDHDGMVSQPGWIEQGYIHRQFIVTCNGSMCGYVDDADILKAIADGHAQFDDRGNLRLVKP